MSSRKSGWLLAAVCLVSLANTGCAQNPFQGIRQWYGQTRQQFKLDSQRNNAYPQPFLSQDQTSIQQVMVDMYAAGDSVNRVLDSVHFDPKTNKLNAAGIHRLQQILSQQKDMEILVSTSMDPKIDSARQQAARELLSQYTFPGGQPKVAGTFYKPFHRAASDVALERENYIANKPIPALETVAGEVSGSTQ